MDNNEEISTNQAGQSFWFLSRCSRCFSASR